LYPGEDAVLPLLTWEGPQFNLITREGAQFNLIPGREKQQNKKKKEKNTNHYTSIISIYSG